MPVPSKSPRGLPRCLGCWLTVSALASASVISDGTRGSVVSHVGADYGLTGGSKVGGNLFHSFSNFDLVSGESATFSGPGDVTNILARITGGSASSIDGTIRSTIPGANLFLMNPKGFVFGPNAKLDVTGSFAVTTADYLKFADRGRFNAQAGGQDSLSSAPVSAFGFLSGTPASVSFNGSQLNVTEGKSFSVVAGDITLDGTRVTGAGSRINLLSVNSSGEARLASPDPLSAIDTAQFSQMGKIALNGSAKIDTSGPVGGRVLIRGGKLVMDTGYINSDTTGSSLGEPIDIAMRESVTITDSTRAPNVASFTSGVSTHADGSAAAGNVLINAPLITLSLGGNIDSQSRGTATVTASGGQIVLHSDQLNILDHFSIVDVDTSGLGAGGSINVTAKEIVMTGSFANGFTGLVADAGNIDHLITTGRGGDITVHADSMRLANGGKISATMLGSGDGGTIRLETGTLTLDGGSRIVSQADHFSTGHGGDISIIAEKLGVLSGSDISVRSFSAGDAGKIKIRAGSVLVDTGEIAAATQNFYNAPVGGNGGSIDLGVKTLKITNGGSITASTSSAGAGGDIVLDTGILTLNQGRISAATFGAGSGGSILIKAENASLIGAGSSSPAVIETRSDDPQSAAHGGDIRLSVSGLLELVTGGSIDSGTNGAGDGGQIEIHAGRMHVLSPDDNVSTGINSTSGNEGIGGHGGNIQLTISGELTMNGGKLSSNSLGAGVGGEIVISARSVTLGQATLIDTSTFGSGRSGDIAIRTGALEIRDATVRTSTFSDGAGGDLMIVANRVFLSAAGVPVVDGELFGGHIQARSDLDARGSGGRIALRVAGPLEIVDGGLVDASTIGPGHGGMIDVVAESILIDGRTSKFPTGIAAETLGIPGGAGGDVTVNTRSLLLLNGGTISAGTQGTGAGGSVSVTANRIEAHGAGSGLRADTTGSDFAGFSPNVGQVTLTIDIEHTYDSDLIAYLEDPSGRQSLLFAGVGGNGANFTHTILSDSATQLIGEGSAPFTGTFRPSEPLTTFRGRSANGYWFLSLKDLAPQDIGTLLGWSLDFGDGHVFRFTGTPLAIPDAGTAAGDSFSRAPILVQLPLVLKPVTAGRGGDVHVNAQEIVITDGARISAETTNQAAGGDVQVRAGSVQITAGASPQSTLISAESTSTGSGGRGGDVLIDAGSLRISGRKGMDTGVSAKSNGFGSSGSITLNLGTLAMDSYATVGSSNTGTGTAGSVSIRAHQGINLSHRSLITTSAAQGDAGNIAITSDASINLGGHSSITASAGSNGGSIRIIAKDILFLTDSSITATAGSVRLASGAGGGTGGNIFIDPKFIILDHSLISANAATGQGGNILLIADNFLPSESLITATGSTVGTVQITAPPLDLANALASLQGAFFDVSTSLQERCAMQLGKEFSSFLVVGRGSVEDSPDEPQEELTARVRQRGKGRVRLR